MKKVLSLSGFNWHSDRIDTIVASESYGENVAKMFDARFLLFDPIVGAESVGKTTLAKKLAFDRGGIYMPEYARTLLELRGKGNEFDRRDFISFARGMHATADLAAEQSETGYVIMDTDHLVTRLYDEVYHGKPEQDDYVLDEICRSVGSRRLHYILLMPVVDWEKDDLRDLPIPREEFTERLHQMIKATRRPVHVIDIADPITRFYEAAQFIDNIPLW